MQGYIIRIGNNKEYNVFYDLAVQEKTTLDQIARAAMISVDEEFDEKYKLIINATVFGRVQESGPHMIDSEMVNVSSIFDTMTEDMIIKSHSSEIFVYFVKPTASAKKYPEIVSSNSRAFVSKNQKLVDSRLAAGKLSAQDVKPSAELLGDLDHIFQKIRFDSFTVVRVNDLFFVINKIRSLSIQIYLNEADFVIGHEHCFPEQTPSLYKRCFYVSLMNSTFAGVKFNYGLGDSNLTLHDLSLINDALEKLKKALSSIKELAGKKQDYYLNYNFKAQKLDYAKSAGLQELVISRVDKGLSNYQPTLTRNRIVPTITMDLVYGIEKENILMGITKPINSVIGIKGYDFDSLVSEVVGALRHYMSIGYSFLKVKTTDLNLYTLVKIAFSQVHTDVIYDSEDQALSDVIQKKDDSQGDYYYNHYRKYSDVLDERFKDFLDYSSSYRTVNYLMSGKDQEGAVLEIEKFLKYYR